MSFRFTISSLVVALCLTGLAGCERGATDTADASAAQSGPGAEKSAKGEKADKADKGANASKSRAVVVSTTTTHIETVPLILEAQGNVIALDDVDVRPQKNGTIKDILFKEGDEVKRGQLLFRLDDRDDVANVKRMDANVAGSVALVSAAERDLARNQDLAAKNFVSPSTLDASRDKLDAARAALDQNKAAAEQARVSLSYTEVRAPFEGRAGLIGVRVGSLVTSTATSTSMVKITRMNPIGVSFSLPEREFDTLMANQRKSPVKVRVDLDANHELHGEVIFIDSSIDRSSGTIAVKAKIENDERRVWPGQFVNVKILAGELKDSVVLPSQAVVNGPNGQLVYIVKDDQTVAAQPITVARIVEQKAVVTGIGPNIKVVLEGGQNLRPGSRVQESKDDGQGGGQGKGRRGRRDGGASAPAADKGNANGAAS
jgi:RND family efflux transporter MFP subunit